MKQIVPNEKPEETIFFFFLRQNLRRLDFINLEVNNFIVRYRFIVKMPYSL